MNNMKEFQPLTETVRYAICPRCGERGDIIDHYLDLDYEENTTWDCDSCGYYYDLRFKDGRVFSSITEERVDKTLVLLRAGHLAIIVEGMSFSEDSDQIVRPDSNYYDRDEYYYNKRICPTNYLKSVQAIVDLRNADTDPHGIFKYVETAPYDKRINVDEDSCSIEVLTEIFPSLIKSLESYSQNG